MINKFLNEIKRNKFLKDVALTLSSNIAVGVSGVLFNTIIGNVYTINNLGIFNQALSAYLFLGVIANLGIRNAVLKFSSESKMEKESAILGSGIIAVSLSSLIISVIIFFCTSFYPKLLFNKEATGIFQYLIFALPFFSLNKVFLAYFNGKRKMRIFSFYTFLRVFLALIFVVFISIFKLKFEFILVSFLISEISIFILMVLHIYIYDKLKFQINQHWIFKNFRFGIQSFLLEIVGQSNLYVDVFFISIFLNPSSVGKYSLAISIVNGLLILSSSVQQNFNPIISNLWSKAQKKELQEAINKIKRKTKLFTLGLFLIAAVLFPLYIFIFFPIQNNLEIIIIFYILLIGFIIPSIYGFSGTLLTMADFLNTYILVAVIALFLNLVSSYFFISFLGLFGASIATSLYHNNAMFLMFYAVKKKMRISIFNTFKFKRKKIEKAIHL